MVSFLTVVTTLIALYLSTFVYCFIRNIFTARKSGFPWLIVPWDQNWFVWIVVSVPLRPWLQKHLPAFIWERLSLTIYGFEFHEKLRPFEQYARPQGDGKSYMLVGAGRAEFWTWDSEITLQILNRPKDFCQMDFIIMFLGKFGDNVFTTEGDRWTRHRKIVAGVINERISKTIFEHSAAQTEGLLAELTESEVDGATETNKLFDMGKKITVNVLSGAGMGAEVQWADETTEQLKDGYKTTYMSSVKTLIDNFTGPIILPRWFLLNYPSFLPGYRFMSSVGHAVDEFPKHTTDMLNQERQQLRASGGTHETNNIMSQLLQASEGTGDSEKGGKGGLSNEEMIGNLFVFTAAGFDTTANTIAYAIALLARYPQWQDWVLEELDDILPSDKEKALDYAAVYPKAMRVMAFMLEVLRLFSPLNHVAKQTRKPQLIQTSHGTYWLPKNTTVYINSISLHLDPEVWGNLNLSKSDEASDDDAHRFRPTRWMNPAGSSQPLFQPPKGTYVPWSGGPRICPGQKMAQVEFVGIFLTLLRKHKIDAVALEGESKTDTERRLDRRMQDSMSVLTLQMNGVYNVSDSPEKGLTMRVSRR